MSAGSSELEVKSLIITVTKEAMPEIERVASNLRQCGMVVEEVLPSIGLIYASATDRVGRVAQALDGVLGIEEDGDIYPLGEPPAGI